MHQNPSYAHLRLVSINPSNYLKSSWLPNVYANSAGWECVPKGQRPVCRVCKAPLQNTEQSSSHIYVTGEVKIFVKF